MEHPIDKRVREQLATLGDRGRATSEAARIVWSENHPTIPCVRCAGKGCYAEGPDGTRRPFDHRDFRAGIDRYEASCPDCRGGGRVATTPEELAAAAEKLEAAARADYRRVRSQVCRLRGITSAMFDRVARNHIKVGKPGAADWLAAARVVRSLYL